MKYICRTCRRSIHNQQKLAGVWRSQKMLSIVSSGMYLLISNNFFCFFAYYQYRILLWTLLFESGLKEAVLHLTLNKTSAYLCHLCCGCICHCCFVDGKKNTKYTKRLDTNLINISQITIIKKIWCQKSV